MGKAGHILSCIALQGHNKKQRLHTYVEVIWRVLHGPKAVQWSISYMYKGSGAELLLCSQSMHPRQEARQGGETVQGIICWKECEAAPMRSDTCVLRMLQGLRGWLGKIKSNRGEAHDLV